MSNLIRKPQSHLEFLWVDGSGANQKLAFRLALKADVKTVKVEGITYAHTAFSPEQFQLAWQIFQLVGRKNTTFVASKLSPTINKGRLARVFDCHATALRSTAKDYCGINIARVSSQVDLNVNLSVLGVSIGADAKPAKRTPPTRHPCKLCYYATAPRPETDEGWKDGLAAVSHETHAALCPRFG